MLAMFTFAGDPTPFGIAGLRQHCANQIDNRLNARGARELWSTLVNGQEQFSVDFTGVTSSTLNNKYITCADNVGPVAFWFNYNGTGVAPTLPGTRLIAVPITVSATDTQCAEALNVAANADSKYLATNSGPVAQIVNRFSGVRTDTSAGTSGLTVATVYQGAVASYTQNTACWAHDIIGLSSKPVWTSVGYPFLGPPYNGGSGGFGSALVAPDLLIAEYHTRNGFQVGTVLKFVTEDGSNTIIERTIVQTGSYQIGGGNLGWWAARLDSELPSSIKWLKVAPANLASYLPDAVVGVPVLRTDSHPLYASVAQFSLLPSGAADLLGAPAASSTSQALRNSYYYLETTGDSGNGVFLVVNGELVLLGQLLTSTGSPLIWLNIANINAAMASAGSIYSLTVADFSAFPTSP